MARSDDNWYSLRSLLVVVGTCAIAFAFIRLSFIDPRISGAVLCSISGAFGLGVAIREERHWRQILRIGVRVKGTIVEVNQVRGYDSNEVIYQCELDGQQVRVASARPRMSYSRIGKSVNLVVDRQQNVAKEWTLFIVGRQPFSRSHLVLSR